MSAMTPPAPWRESPNRRESRTQRSSHDCRERPVPVRSRAGVLGIALLAAILAATDTGCVREPAPTENKPGPRVPQQVLEGVHLRQTSLKGLLWVLEADSGISYGQDEPTRLKHLTVRFYDGGTEVRSTLTSKRGEVEEKTQSLIARDSVVVVTPEGERLETQSLHWDPKKQQIQTEDFFKLTRGHDVLTGIGIETDPDLVHYVVHKQVRAEMRDESDSRMLETLDGDSTAHRSPRAK